MEQMKKVLCPVENAKSGKTWWMRIGKAYINRDGSTNVYLDAFPANKTLQIRDLDERDLERLKGNSGPKSGGEQDLPF